MGVQSWRRFTRQIVAYECARWADGSSSRRVGCCGRLHIHKTLPFTSERFTVRSSTEGSYHDDTTSPNAPLTAQASPVCATVGGLTIGRVHRTGSVAWGDDSDVG